MASAEGLYHLKQLGLLDEYRNTQSGGGTVSGDVTATLNDYGTRLAKLEGATPLTDSDVVAMVNAVLAKRG